MQENAQSALRAHSSSIRGSRKTMDIPEANVADTGKLQDFIKEDVLVGIVNVYVMLSFFSIIFFYLLLTVSLFFV